MKIIKLTECGINAATKPVYINTLYIKSFNKSNKGKDTRLEMHDRSYFFVQETEEMLAKLLED